MSATPIQLEEKQSLSEKQVVQAGRARPVWLVVLKREFSELWIGGKALTLILLYSVYLGVSSFVFASNSELSLIPPPEMIFLTISGAITVGLFVALIIGADSFSGERERSTLEALLLTRANRRQIVIGKFLASVSPWPVALTIAIPFVVVLSQGNEVTGTALIWGAILGTLLSPAFTGFGMLVSIWSSSNKTSLFASLTTYLLFLLPVQFPGGAQTGTIGKLLKKLNPLEGADHFLEKIIVNNRTAAELMPFLWASIIFALVVFVLLFFYAAPRLSLDGGIPIRIQRNRSQKSIIGIFLIAFLILSTNIHSVRALDNLGPSLQITIDEAYQQVKTGDTVEFNTRVTNSGAEASPPLIVAMNVINLDAAGDVVDPEDWSPQRTQYIDTLAAGATVETHWIINTILEGDYMVYMVLIPEPENPASTSQPVATSGIHLTVAPFTRLNPGGVLPYVVGVPLLVLVGTVVLYRLRRRQVDEGGSR